MRTDFAPMEGLTGYAFRNVHARFYPGADRYFTPFLSANHTFSFQQKELEDIAPENNRGICLVPQILTNDADQAVWALGEIASLGYQEININIGCPSPTVTAKGKGAGMLRTPDRLEGFLDSVFMKAGDATKISVKTRIGWSDPAEALNLMRIYNRFPLSELIIHARVKKAMYGGNADRETFAEMYEMRNMPVVYNGDIRSREDAEGIALRFPDLAGIMIGRGLVADPALAEKIRGTETGEREKERFEAFHKELLASLIQRFKTEKAAVGHMKEYWFYWQMTGKCSERAYRQIRKSQDRYSYEAAVNAALSEPV